METFAKHAQCTFQAGVIFTFIIDKDEHIFKETQMSLYGHY